MRPILSSFIAKKLDKMASESAPATSAAHCNLIAAINEAINAQVADGIISDPVPGLRMQIDALARRLDQSLEREVALLHELYDLRAQCKQLAEENRLLKMGRLVAVR